MQVIDAPADAELAPVETIRPGDEIVLLDGTLRLVSAVNRSETLGVREVENYVVVYFQHGDVAFENSARRNGAAYLNRIVEKGLRPLLRGETWTVVRGDPRAAERVRGDMLLAEAERAALDEARIKRAHAHGASVKTVRLGAATGAASNPNEGGS